MDSGEAICRANMGTWFVLMILTKMILSATLPITIFG